VDRVSTMCSGGHGFDSCPGDSDISLSYVRVMLNNSSFTFHYLSYLSRKIYFLWILNQLFFAAEFLNDSLQYCSDRCFAFEIIYYFYCYIGDKTNVFCSKSATVKTQCCLSTQNIFWNNFDQNGGHQYQDLRFTLN